ncbi:hypothetical protein [Mesorhizobium sp. M0028]|uniref:hypothetical protein n=1 Tax=unclassified Mesorhizobium TaxID=325217 RepID=UPI00333DF604
MTVHYFLSPPASFPGFHGFADLSAMLSAEGGSIEDRDVGDTAMLDEYAGG